MWFVNPNLALRLVSLMSAANTQEKDRYQEVVISATGSYQRHGGIPRLKHNRRGGVV